MTQAMQYIRDTYRVPAKVGTRVRYTGRREPICGTITSATNAHIRVRLDGETGSGHYHPTWRIEYLQNEGA